MHRNCMSLIFMCYMFLTTLLHAGEQVTINNPEPLVPTQQKSLSSTVSTSVTPLTIEQIRANLPTATANRFEFLRRQRKTSLEAIDETSSQMKALTASIDVAQSRLDSLREAQERMSFGLPAPALHPSSPPRRIPAGLSRLFGMSREQLIEALKLAREDIEKVKAISSEENSQKENINEKESYVERVQYALDTYDERQEEEQERKRDEEERKKIYDQRTRELDESRAKIDIEIKTVVDDLSQLNGQRNKLTQSQILYQRLLGEIDDIVNQLFIASDATNSFKLRMSITFSVLVLIVIAGFYIIAWSNEDVKKTIFSNESGIQFITLFAIVIAVILFGIINILEGRELAALLGGLSGYILGRGRESRE